MPTPTEKTAHLIATTETRTVDVPDLISLVDRIFVGQRLESVEVDDDNRIHFTFENRQSFIFRPEGDDFWIGRSLVN